MIKATGMFKWVYYTVGDDTRVGDEDIVESVNVGQWHRERASTMSSYGQSKGYVATRTRK